jgi:hypothetical protein
MIPCDISSTVGTITLILMEANMKRAAILGMFAAVVATAWTFLAAQSSPGPRIGEHPAAPAVSAIRAPSGPLTPLQQRFVELSAKKAHLMTEEQLQQALNNLDREVEELNAWSKIEESARFLREVVEKHPQTKAAEAAKSALNAIDQNRPATTPFPDPRFKVVPGFQRDSTPFDVPSERHRDVPFADEKRAPTS